MSLFAHGRGAYPAGDVVLPSIARTANPADVTIGTTGATGLIVVINVTAAAIGASVVFTIRGVTPDDIEYDILVSAAVTATGKVRLQVHPNLTAATNLKADDLLPDRVRIHAEHATTDSITYSVSAVLTP